MVSTLSCIPFLRVCRIRWHEWASARSVQPPEVAELPVAWQGRVDHVSACMRVHRTLVTGAVTGLSNVDGCYGPGPKPLMRWRWTPQRLLSPEHTGTPPLLLHMHEVVEPSRAWLSRLACIWTYVACRGTYRTATQAVCFLGTVAHRLWAKAFPCLACHSIATSKINWVPSPPPDSEDPRSSFQGRKIYFLFCFRIETT